MSALQVLLLFSVGVVFASGVAIPKGSYSVSTSDTHLKNLLNAVIKEENTKINSKKSITSVSTIVGRNSDKDYKYFVIYNARFASNNAEFICALRFSTLKSEPSKPTNVYSLCYP